MSAVLDNNFIYEMTKCVYPFGDAVKAVMAQEKWIDKRGRIVGTERVFGYVCNIYPEDAKETDKSGNEISLYGMVDVQEYNCDEGKGLHEKVLLGAIRNNMNGYVAVPSLMSDVMIAKDPVSGNEYVVMVSHVDVINTVSHNEVSVGVLETEPYVYGEENNVEDLRPTGNQSISHYTKDGIEHSVMSDGNDIASISHKADSIEISVKDSVVTIDKDGNINLKGKNITIEADTIKHNNGTEKMVKGNQLVSTLQSLCNALSSLTVTTHVGPAPVTNPGAFSSIAGQLNSILSDKSSLD